MSDQHVKGRHQQCDSSKTPRAASRALGALLLAGLMTSGCYKYVPVDPAGVKPNEEVRVRITEPAATRLVRDFGAYTSQLEGQFAPQGSDSVSVSVLIGRAAGTLTLESTRQTLFLGRSEVVQVQRRELSRSRTALATAGILAVFALVVNSVVQIGDENPSGEEPPPPPPPSGFVGRIRIPIRWGQ